MLIFGHKIFLCQAALFWERTKLSTERNQMERLHTIRAGPLHVLGHVYSGNDNFGGCQLVLKKCGWIRSGCKWPIPFAFTEICLALGTPHSQLPHHHTGRRMKR